MAEIVPSKDKEVDEEVYETENINDDWDQINLEKVIYNKFSGTSYSQQS